MVHRSPEHIEEEKTQHKVDKRVAVRRSEPEEKVKEVYDPYLVKLILRYDALMAEIEREEKAKRDQEWLRRNRDNASWG